MEIILGIIFGLFTAVGIAILVKANRERAKSGKPERKRKAPAAGCCGAHEVCELDEAQLNANLIEYFDDEELDEYKNIDEKNYTPEQIDQFREVLYTLRTEEIRSWLLSIERRQINLPDILVSEARTLMAEA